MNFLPKATIGVGIGLIILSVDRLFDSVYSQLMFISGCVLIGFAKMFDLILKQKDRTDEIDKGLSGLQAWAVNELEKGDVKK